MVSLWLLLKVFCIVIAIPQNLGDFQVNTASQSPHSSKLHLQDDQVSQSQWGDSGRVSETFESFQREMEARIRALEAKSARQEQLFATVLENFGHRMKESEETFERFRKEMEEKIFELERKSHAQELKTFNLIGEIGDRDRMFERFRQEMEERLYEHEKKSAAQEIKMLDLMRVIEHKERKSQEISDAFEIITKNPEFSDLIQRSKMGAFPGKIHYLYDILCLRHLFNWPLCFEDFFNLLIKRKIIPFSVDRKG